MSSAAMGVPISAARKFQYDAALLEGLAVIHGNLETDSRRVRPGDTFLAFPGEGTDGRKFIGQAIAAGAGAVLWEREGFQWDQSWAVPNHAVPSLRQLAGPIASQVYGEPSRKMWIVGVTGTNGKTSCAHWLANAFTAQKRKTAVVGTLGNGFPGELDPTVNTTPDPVGLQRQLAGYHGQGAEGVVMEVSSHGLVQGRVNGVAFDVAMLTNLSRDHLDYHGDMERYGQAKATLFDWDSLQYAVLNLDDAFGISLASQLDRPGLKMIGYGLGQGDVRGRHLRVDEQGLQFEVESPWGRTEVRSQLLGIFNAQNLLGVLTTLLISDVPLDTATEELEKLAPVSGRMQKLGGDDKPLVVVDYAHTPDALEKTLGALREVIQASGLKGARLICVFGCGGDRDKGKRPLMGQVVSQLADSAFVTSDNPRSEDPRSILNEIVEGMHANYHLVEDRAEAIYQAVSGAQPGDIVLIAGKGHEAYQEINGIRLPFSDAEVALRVLREGAR